MKILMKKHAIKVMSKQANCRTANDVLKSSFKKEKALKYLIKYNPDAYTMDESIDRMWIEHQPYNTIYSFLELEPKNTAEYLKANYAENECIGFNIYMDDFEYTKLLDENSDTELVISTTGKFMDVLKKYFQGNITIVINDEIQLALNIFNYANQSNSKVPKEVHLSREDLNKLISQ